MSHSHENPQNIPSWFRISLHLISLSSTKNFQKSRPEVLSTNNPCTPVLATVAAFLHHLIIGNQQNRNFSFHRRQHLPDRPFRKLEYRKITKWNVCEANHIMTNAKLILFNSQNHQTRERRHRRPIRSDAHSTLEVGGRRCCRIGSTTPE